MVVAALGLAGCSGAPAAATSPAAVTPSTATLAPGVSPFPAQDTAIDDASPALAATWRPYGVTLIPSSQVLTGVDSAVQGISASNASGGAFSDAQVQQLVTAYVRDQVLAGWAAEHVQPSLGAHLAGELFLVGPDSMALAAGTALHYGSCALFPTTMAVLAPNPAFDAQLTSSNQDIQPQSFPVRLGFTGCAVTGTTRSGQTITVDPAAGPGTVVADAILRHDPVLGDILFLEGGTTCPDPAVPSVCGS